ncbi:hypothetical protein Afil01_26300 [Actinorhabdospora filicis]|uniref:Uncharacterized protein n=1 Tax=Actinorhabdospora filicis TaxID=1785913 RepID=A0A9W6SKC0_9ACTN|nr:hypothetical protein [Actinorhabdospora filicis]GLZ77823.1 hypothetical protein Afil01_26300 [Actinorhabdospora filicis]
MCVAAGPAELTDTIVYVGRAAHPEHGSVEVLGYQNTAASRADGPNAMLLHLPAAAPMSGANFLHVGRHTDLLTRMADAIPAPVAAGGMDWMDGEAAVTVFEHDVYTVVLAADATAIPAALGGVPEHRRPTVSPELIAFYATTFPRHTIALCCFDNADAERARPLLLWYEPLDPAVLTVPALDSHTGGVPEPGAPVERGHTLVFGADDVPGSIHIGHPPGLDRALRPFLPESVTGLGVIGEGPNGDFALPLTDLRAGRLEGLRVV